MSIGQPVLRCEHSAIWVWNRDMARSDCPARGHVSASATLDDDGVVSVIVG